MAAVAVLLAVVDLTNVVQLWMLYVIVFVFGLALAVDNPTRQSFVPELVPPEDLPNAVGLSSAIFQVARILGPALGGVLIVAVGTGVCFALNAVSFVFIVAALLMMRTGELYRGAPLGREKGQVREGLRYVWHTPELRSTLLLTLIVGTFAINSPVVLPLLAKITFGGNAEVYSWMTIAMGAGAVFGALFVANKALPRAARSSSPPAWRSAFPCSSRPSRRRWGCSSHCCWSSGRGRSPSSPRATRSSSSAPIRSCAAG